jgi:hypothetical protein
MKRKFSSTLERFSNFSQSSKSKVKTSICNFLETKNFTKEDVELIFEHCAKRRVSLK